MISFIETALQAHGLSDIIPSHGNILTVLYEAKEPMTMKAIAERIGKDKSTVTFLVNRLIELGYVGKTAADFDKRVSLIALTDLGRAKEADYRLISNAVTETAYRGFSEDEKETFLALLKRMNQNFTSDNREKEA